MMTKYVPGFESKTRKPRTVKPTYSWLRGCELWWLLYCYSITGDILGYKLSTPEDVAPLKALRAAVDGELKRRMEVEKG